MKRIEYFIDEDANEMCAQIPPVHPERETNFRTAYRKDAVKRFGLKRVKAESAEAKREFTTELEIARREFWAYWNMPGNEIPRNSEKWMEHEKDLFQQRWVEPVGAEQNGA